MEGVERTGQRYGVCLGKAYDAAVMRELLADLELDTHIRGRGEEARDLKQHPGGEARRWVAESCRSSLNR
ncbi:MAG: hypothetical protein AAF333_12290 [Planctomycetota bacterium]